MDDSTMIEMSATSLPTNTISPFEQMVAYETLWAVPGMTEAKLSDLFRHHDDFPASVLAKFKQNQQLSFIDDDPLVALQKSVRDFVTKKLGNFSIVVNRDFQYPVGLRDAKHPIEVFYYRGNLDLLNTRCVSIVGARKASPDGISRAITLARGLVQSGFTIVSGLAAGIDTAAQTTAISSHGQTIGVIGTPIDEYYPRENKELQNTIAKNHLLISQVPFYRYKHEAFQNHKHYFPRRNVTMASISEATIIVEASDTSGSLTQARACISQNKKLFILDSCFRDSRISWPKTYEAQGAIRVQKLSDILDRLK